MKETEHGWTGIYRDGGYIGDSQLSGHLSWKKEEDKPTEPTNPTDPLSS